MFIVASSDTGVLAACEAGGKMDRRVRGPDTHDWLIGQIICYAKRPDMSTLKLKIFTIFLSTRKFALFPDAERQACLRNGPGISGDEKGLSALR
jgi:hypothetical protein